MYLSTKGISSLLKSALLTASLAVAATSSAQINGYEVGDMGYLRTPMETANGIIVTNNSYSEIYTLKNNVLTPILKANNCGLYTNLSKDGKYLGFKSFDAHDYQAPALLDVTTGAVTVLEDYAWECGQPSFSNDGTIAYTLGNNLIVRKGDSRKAFDLGFYTNIANISPDATKVAYSNIQGQTFVIDLTTGAKEIIAVEDGYRATWSPDGQKIAIQTGIGKVAVLDRATKRVHDLGLAESVSWANNSNELIITRQERENEFVVKSSSIKRVNFDGSNEITLVSSSSSLPVDAILTSDNQLVIPYKTGVKRGLALKDFSTGITPSSASVAEKSVIALEEEDVVGGRISDPNENPDIKPSIVPASGTIGQLDIPYLSQIYDSPSMSGCTSYGHVTCAPTTACMHLGYYGLLNKKATSNRYDGTTKYYAYAIGQQFTNQAGTKTFNEGAYKNCATIYGGYGYMWTGSNTPGGGRMGTFYTLNGATSTTYTWSSSTAWSWLDSEAAAGRPSPLCIALRSSGHLILGFRTNQYYRTSEGGFVARSGCFVCHDPYGDANDSTWADNDGQHSSYDWIGYNSGRQNIGTFYWSIKVAMPANANPGTTVETGITCNPSSITLEGEVGSSTAKYVDVKVKGQNLSTNISVNSATSAITVEKLSGWNDLTGGTIRCTLNTNFSKGAGTYESYIAVQSTSSYRVEIATKVTLTDPSGSTATPTISATPTSASMSTPAGTETTKTFTVTGSNLSGDISAYLAGDDVFSIDKTSLGSTGGTITVSYKPVAEGSNSTTLTLSSSGAASVNVSITGTAEAALPSVSEGLSLVWKNTTVPGSAGGGDVRFAGVSNGHLLAADKAGLKLIELTETGYSDYYDLSSAFSTHWSAATMGPAIGCDDAGNILVHCGWSGATSGSNFLLVSADLKSTYKIDLSTVSGYTAARCDQMGRIRGNMLSDEGAYAFIVTNGATQILIVKIVNGTIDAGYTQLSTACGVTLSTSTVAQPAFATVAEIDALMDENGDVSNSFVMRNRSYPQNVYTWKEDASAMEATSFTASTAEGYSTKSASSEGFDWFKLGEVSYYIMPLTTDGTTNGRSNAFAIFDGEGNIKAYHAEDLKTGVGQGMGSFIVAPRDNNSVFIYQFMAGTVAKKFIYHNGKTTGVEEIEAAAAADENAPVEYYNLQGIKVKNPSNGIYIKVQGSKVSKVLIRE